MEFKKPRNKIDQNTLLLSPTRKQHFRSCKSPLKKECSLDESKKDLKENIDNHLAKDLVKQFPCIHENFDIVKKVGEGTFSKVYLGKYRKHPHPMIAIKHLIPTSSPKRIENELKCLQIVGGKNNVLGLECALRKEDHIIFILPYMPHQKFSSYFRNMKNDGIQQYMKNLFIALKHVHSYNIIHRDVKPSNFIYCKEKDAYTLIDFGLAMSVPGSTNSLLKDYNKSSSERVLKPVNNNTLSGGTDAKKSKSDDCTHTVREVCSNCLKKPRQSAPRAGTPGFRSPEVLMKYQYQTTAVDMWAAGVILLSLLSGRYPFFTAKDDMEALGQIKALFLTSDMKRMALKIGKLFECSLGREESVLPLRTLCKRLAKRNCTLHPSQSSENRKRSLDGLGSFSPSKKVKQQEKSFETSDDDARQGQSHERKKVCHCINDQAYDLLEKLLTLDPHKRISAENALKHPFITSTFVTSSTGDP